MIDIYSDNFGYGFLAGQIFGMCCTFVIVLLGVLVEKDHQRAKSQKEDSDNA